MSWNNRCRSTLFVRRSFLHLRLSSPIFFLLLTVVTGCGVTQPVRVAEEGTTHVLASLGGPLIPYAGMTIPVPYLNAGLLYGAGADVSYTGNLHLTMLLFGNLGVDAGYVRRLTQERGWIPELTAKGQLYFFSDLEDIRATRVFPLVTVNASYCIGSTLVYFGTDHLVQVHLPAYFLSPFVGIEVPLSERWRVQGEAKWMAANVNTAHGIFEGHGSIGGYGNIGTFIGCTLRW